MGQWKYRFDKPEPRNVRGMCVLCEKNPQKKEKGETFRPLCSQCCKRLYTGSANSRKKTKTENQNTVSVARNISNDEYVGKSKIRTKLVEKIGGEFCERCHWDEYPQVLHVHHIVERSRGGSNHLNNLELLCPRCHEVEHYLRRTRASGQLG